MSPEPVRDDEGVRYAFGLPYRWQPRKVLRGMWNPADDRVFPPKYFGVGWTVNFHALARKVGLLPP